MSVSLWWRLTSGMRSGVRLRASNLLSVSASAFERLTLCFYTSMVEASERTQSTSECWPKGEARWASMPRNICLAFGRVGSLFLLTSSVSADWVVCLYIIARLLFIQQPGDTHGIYRSGQITLPDKVGSRSLTNYFEAHPLPVRKPKNNRRTFFEFASDFDGSVMQAHNAFDNR